MSERSHGPHGESHIEKGVESVPESRSAVDDKIVPRFGLAANPSESLTDVVLHPDVHSVVPGFQETIRV